MPLQFVNHGAIGREERRLIRSHVMKGKNAGRPRRSGRRLPSGPPVRPTWGARDPKACAKPDESRTAHSDGSALDVRRVLWDDLALSSFPQPLSAESKKYMRQWFLAVSEGLYPLQFCSQFGIMDSIWVRYVHLDEAYFHTALAMSASYADTFLGRPRFSPEGLIHLSKAYALINQRLSGPGATSDSAVAVVTTLAIYQRLHHQHSTGLVHFDGLCRMIQLRGGIVKLTKEKRQLAHKAWRLDLEFSLQDGSKSRLWKDAMPYPAMRDKIQPQRTLGGMTKHLRGGPDIDAKLLGLYTDSMDFAEILNTRVEGSKLNPLDYSETILLLLHRMIQFAPLGGPRPRHQVDNLMHLALIAFMTTLLPEYGRGHSRYDLLSQHMRRAVQDFRTTESHDRRLLLWVLFVSGISVWKDSENQRRVQLLPSLSEECVHLQLHTWPDVQEMLYEGPWIHALHDKVGRSLWEAMVQEIGREDTDSKIG